MTFSHRLPSSAELRDLHPIDLTADTPWDPTDHYGNSPLVFPSVHAPQPVQAHTLTGQYSLSSPPPFDPGDSSLPCHGHACPLIIPYKEFLPPLPPLTSDASFADLVTLPLLVLGAPAPASPPPPSSLLYYRDLFNSYHSITTPTHLHLFLTTKRLPQDLIKLQPYLAYQSLEVIKHTLSHNTQFAKTFYRYPLRRHVQSRFPQGRRLLLTPSLPIAAVLVVPHVLRFFTVSHPMLSMSMASPQRAMRLVPMKTSSVMKALPPFFDRTTLRSRRA